MLNAKDLLSLAKHANNKAHYYLDKMNAAPFASGNYIDARVDADRYIDYLDQLIKDAHETLTVDEYKVFINSIE